MFFEYRERLAQRTAIILQNMVTDGHMGWLPSALMSILTADISTAADAMMHAMREVFKLFLFMT